MEHRAGRQAVRRAQGAARPRVAEPAGLAGAVANSRKCGLCAEGLCLQDKPQMALAVGTRLGPYEILSVIGAGGPPPLACLSRELWRDRAAAQHRRTQWS